MVMKYCAIPTRGFRGHNGFRFNAAEWHKATGVGDGRAAVVKA